MAFSFRPMDPATAAQLLTWHYPEPYALYTLVADDANAQIRYLTDPANAYYAVITPMATCWPIAALGLMPRFLAVPTQRMPWTPAAGCAPI
jgi:hypothetical protein